MFLFSFPKCWTQKSFINYLLWPLSIIYYLIFALIKLNAKPIELQAVTICIGNINVGGSGKTPVLLSLASLLKESFPDISCITRGYAGKNRGPLKIDPSSHDSVEVGDEALLLSHHLPCFIAKKRFKAGQLAIENGAKMLLLDDGLQHFAVKKDISCLVIDEEVGFYNELLLPAGPLRESWEGVKDSVDIVFLLTSTRKKAPLPFLKQLEGNMKLFKGAMEIQPPQHYNVKDKNLIAFAAIGRPEKFFASLKEKHYNILECFSYPDHYVFKESELAFMLTKADTLHARLVTTYKDFMRLSPLWKSKVIAVNVSIIWEKEEELKEFLHKKIVSIISHKEL